MRVLQLAPEPAAALAQEWRPVLGEELAEAQEQRLEQAEEQARAPEPRLVQAVEQAQVLERLWAPVWQGRE